MHSGAPLSPLITSTATDGMRYERSLPPAQQLFFGLDFGRFFDDAFAAIKTVGSDAVTQMGFARLRIDRHAASTARRVNDAYRAWTVFYDFSERAWNQSS
jgi:hypothetical protein